MCTGGDCVKKSTCYRHIATPSSYQSFFAEVPKEADCKHYWEMSQKGKSSDKNSSKRIT